MTNISLVLGGCKSGKSAFALEQANKKKTNKYFIATSIPLDKEMKQRIQKHKKQRDKTWTCIEEPINIYDTINKCALKADVIIIDCLTIWVSNLLLLFCKNQRKKETFEIKEEVKLLKKALKKTKCPVYLVSNEVGYGVVPDNKLGRNFRDLVGFVNQSIAKTADKVFITIAGINKQIKP